MAWQGLRRRPTPSRNLATPRVAESDLLQRLLPGVSRSFALSLRVLPAPLRRPLGLTYLLARTADTLADTRAVPPADRRRALEALRAALDGGDAAPLTGLAALVPADQPAAERELVDRLPKTLAAWQALDGKDRTRSRTVLLILTRAMQEALERFPAERDGRVAALETRAELDRYTYMNAGCVGEFWTEMAVAHRPRCAGCRNLPLMRARAARFGQGLQLVNVLRDLPRDLRIGRCYLPRVELAALGLTPAELLDPAAIDRLRPLLDALIRQAVEQLHEGLSYTLAWPRAEVRLRLACAWPLLIGFATLARLRRSADLLNADVVVKVPRAEVQRQLAVSALLVWSNRGLGGYARLIAPARGGSA